MLKISKSFSLNYARIQILWGLLLGGRFLPRLEVYSFYGHYFFFNFGGAGIFLLVIRLRYRTAVHTLMISEVWCVMF